MFYTQIKIETILRNLLKHLSIGSLKKVSKNLGPKDKMFLWRTAVLSKMYLIQSHQNLQIQPNIQSKLSKTDTFGTGLNCPS